MPLCQMVRLLHNAGLLRAVHRRGILVAARDLPERRLLAVARPAAARLLPDGILAGLVLPVVVAAGEHQPLLRPDDLTADVEAEAIRLSATSPACSAPCQT